MFLPLAGLLAVQILAPVPVANSPFPSVEQAIPTRKDLNGDALPPHAVGRFGTRRFQHAGGVSAAAWAPDGKTLAAVGFDGEVVLWEVPSGRALQRLCGWAGRVHALAFSPDGRWLALCGSVLQVWDLRTSREVIYYSFPGKRPLVAFSPDASCIAIVDMQDRLRLWELVPGFPAQLYDDPRRRATALAVAAPDNIHTLARIDGVQTLLSFPDTLNPQTVVEEDVAVQGAAFTADVRTLAVATDKQLRLYDADSGEELSRFESASPFAATPVISADGQWLAALHADGTARVWNLRSGRESLRVEAALAPVSVALSPDGKRLALIAGATQALQIWDVADGRCLVSPPTHTSAVEAVALSPDGQYAVTAARRGDPAARLWDTTTGQLVREFRAPAGGLTSVAFSQDGRWLLTAHHGDDCGVRLWEVRSGELVRALAKRDAVEQAVFTPDGAAIVAAAVGERNWQPYTDVTVWERETGDTLLHLSRDGGPTSVAVSPDGRQIIAAGQGAQCWDARTGRERPLPSGSRRDLRRVIHSPDGYWFALCFESHRVEIWETLAPRGPLLSIPGDAVAFSPTGRFVALAFQKDISIIDLSTVAVILKLEGHDATVGALAFAADGKRLLSGSADATSLVWDLSDLARVSLLPQTDPVERAWVDLVSSNVSVANRAAWNLTAAGDPAVTLLKAKLHPSSAAQAKALRRLLAELDDEDFDTRQEATKGLARQLDETRDALYEALENNPSAEVRRRIRALLAGDIDDVPNESARMLRAVAVLERIGSASAQSLLKQLAAGTPGTLRTRQARAALQRLKRRQAKD